MAQQQLLQVAHRPDPVIEHHEREVGDLIERLHRRADQGGILGIPDLLFDQLFFLLLALHIEIGHHPRHTGKGLAVKPEGLAAHQAADPGRIGRRRLAGAQPGRDLLPALADILIAEGQTVSPAIHPGDRIEPLFRLEGSDDLTLLQGSRKKALLELFRLGSGPCQLTRRDGGDEAAVLRKGLLKAPALLQALLHHPRHLAVRHRIIG